MSNVTPPRRSSRPARSWRLGHLALAIVILLGAALRLVWVSDMEYKFDESWMYERFRYVGSKEPFPWVGMPSSVGLRNPGLSVWVFLALGHLTRAQDPTDLARAVQVLNIIAILLVVFFAVRLVAEGQREPWLWAAALVCVSPPAIIFQRKIWAQSVLPFFAMPTVVAWWNRDTRLGALAWGLLGTCLGQIHMAGFFFAAGLALWCLLFDRQNVRWGSWLLGSAVGALPMVPWFVYLVPRVSWSTGAAPARGWLGAKFWLLWMTESLGLEDIRYILGAHFSDFLGYPLVGQTPTYLVTLALATAIVATGLILLKGGVVLWERRGTWAILLTGRGSHTTLAVNAATIAFGLLLTLAPLRIYRYYLLAAFPVSFVWLALVALARTDSRLFVPTFGRIAMAVLSLASLVTSATFLLYIHVHGGAPQGDYGRSYAVQRAMAAGDDACRSAGPGGGGYPADWTASARQEHSCLPEDATRMVPPVR